MVPQAAPHSVRIRTARVKIGTKLSPLARRWLREPLLHFLLAGALLFAIYELVNPAANRTDHINQIVLTEDDLRQLAVRWLAQGRPPPTADEMRALVEERVRQEILFREARALGLDKDDEIVKRRMAQKMDFLAADVAALQYPSDAELEAWFAQNSDRFALPPRVSFRHLYFSSDRPGARDRAAAILASSLVSRPSTRSRSRVPIPSCSRTTTPNELPTRSPRSLARPSRRRCFSSSPVRGRGRSSQAMAGISSSLMNLSRAECPRSRKSSPTSNPRCWIKSSAKSNGPLSKRCGRATWSLSRPLNWSTWEACGLRRRSVATVPPPVSPRPMFGGGSRSPCSACWRR